MFIVATIGFHNSHTALGRNGESINIYNGLGYIPVIGAVLRLMGVFGRNSPPSSQEGRVLLCFLKIRAVTELIGLGLLWFPLDIIVTIGRMFYHYCLR